jgi:hypothetical protein
MRYEPRCKHKNGYDCDICDKSYEDYKINSEDCDDCIDDKYCHYENDDVSGCGVLIYETLRDEFLFFSFSSSSR